MSAAVTFPVVPVLLAHEEQSAGRRGHPRGIRGARPAQLGDEGVRDDHPLDPRHAIKDGEDRGPGCANERFPGLIRPPRFSIACPCPFPAPMAVQMPSAPWRHRCLVCFAENPADLAVVVQANSESGSAASKTHSGGPPRATGLPVLSAAASGPKSEKRMRISSLPRPGRLAHGLGESLRLDPDARQLPTDCLRVPLKCRQCPALPKRCNLS